MMIRVRMETMGAHIRRIVGKSQSALITINPSTFLRILGAWRSTRRAALGAGGCPVIMMPE
jgi:hypothetical protein